MNLICENNLLIHVPVFAGSKLQCQFNTCCDL